MKENNGTFPILLRKGLFFFYNLIIFCVKKKPQKNSYSIYQNVEERICDIQGQTYYCENTKI